MRGLRSGTGILWALLGAVALLGAASSVLFARTAVVRHERDVSRMVYNDNLELLETVRRASGAVQDSVQQVTSLADPVGTDSAYIVVSIEDHKLWYKRGDSTLFETEVATGSGKVLDGESGGSWKFETPRGRLKVQAKETDPAWVPPDWHFVEQARKRGMGTVRLDRGQSIPSADGGSITVVGTEVVKRYPDGRTVPMGGGEEGREIVVGGNIVIPPYGSSQRKYKGVLGTHRLVLGDGYALHGTNKPETIGRSVSHGCVRLRNADIAALYAMVSVGTPVFIY